MGYDEWINCIVSKKKFIVLYQEKKNSISLLFKIAPISNLLNILGLACNTYLLACNKKVYELIFNFFFLGSQTIFH
jgi:hypothetical protein